MPETLRQQTEIVEVNDSESLKCTSSHAHGGKRGGSEGQAEDIEEPTLEERDGSREIGLGLV